MRRIIDAFINTSWDEILEDGDDRLQYFCVAVALTAALYFGSALIAAIMR